MLQFLLTQIGKIKTAVSSLSSNINSLNSKKQVNITPVDGVTIVNNGLYENGNMVSGSVQLTLENQISAYANIATGFPEAAGDQNVEAIMYHSNNCEIYMHNGSLSARGTAIPAGTYFFSLSYFKK